MKTQLQLLRSHLSRLQSSRKLIRRANGFSLLVTATVAILLCAFLSDWVLDMSVAQRVVLSVLSIASVVWAYKRFTFPWLIVREDIVDVALLVERQQGIDSDLVSAMQFEKPQAEKWGSPQLKDAVIDQVAETSKGINVFEGFSFQDFKRRLGIAVVSLVLLVGWGVIFPGYFGAFFNRLAFGSAQYPTATHIASIAVNDEVMLGPDAKDVVFSPFGHGIRFRVQAARDLPADGIGRVHIRSLDSAISTDIVLTVVEDSDADGKSASYTGELPRLMDSVTFEVYLGDARSLPLTINAIPLPVVEVELDVTPPSYAAGLQTKFESVRQISVIEGSRVKLKMRSLNKKLDHIKLALDLGHDTTIVINHMQTKYFAEHVCKVMGWPKTDDDLIQAAKAGDLKDADVLMERIVKMLDDPRSTGLVEEFQKQNADPETKKLPARDEQLRAKLLTQLRELTKIEQFDRSLKDLNFDLPVVTQPIQYRLDVVDTERLSMESPIHGTIRLRVDQAPQTAIAMRTRKVVPTGKPPVMWAASDDFGLSKVVAILQVARVDGESEEREIEIAAPALSDGGAKSLGGKYTLDLEPFKLVKGDELKLTFRAYDYRGDDEPKHSFSEPVILQITDQQGVISGLLETDEESAKKLDEISRRVLGIGRSK